MYKGNKYKSPSQSEENRNAKRTEIPLDIKTNNDCFPLWNAIRPEATTYVI